MIENILIPLAIFSISVLSAWVSKIYFERQERKNEKEFEVPEEFIVGGLFMLFGAFLMASTERPKSNKKVSLQDELQKAIEREDYESAALLRDLIKDAEEIKNVNNTTQI